MRFELRTANSDLLTILKGSLYIAVDLPDGTCIAFGHRAGGGSVHDRKGVGRRRAGGVRRDAFGRINEVIPLIIISGGERKTTIMDKTLSESLSEQDVIYFKALLNQQLDDLLHQAKRTVDQLVKDGTMAADLVDQAASEMDREYTIRIRDRESRLIQKIKTALEKIEEGTFGTCEKCGEPISVARLMARPVAIYCIQCKSNMEAMEKRSGH
jgi:DnaK suppressor protein